MGVYPFRFELYELFLRGSLVRAFPQLRRPCTIPNFVTAERPRRIAVNGGEFIDGNTVARSMSEGLHEVLQRAFIISPSPRRQPGHSCIGRFHSAVFDEQICLGPKE